MDELDKKILTQLQTHVPLTHRPWKNIADAVDMDEQNVLTRICNMRSTGLIRRIGGIFDAAALGYSQSLVAFEIPPADLEQAGVLVSTHPGVSHCYSRADEFNLWFTLAVSPGSRLGLEKTVDILGSRCNAKSRLILPVGRCFKLNVRFDFDQTGKVKTLPVEKETSSPQTSSASAEMKITDLYRRVVLALQTDLQAIPEPFTAIAKDAGMGEDELFTLAGELLDCGVLRRYSAVLAHRPAGANANVMVVWPVENDRIEQAGKEAAINPAVSHCYHRPARPGWPYSLYTMIHGRTREDCKRTIEQIAQSTRLSDWRELWTEREFKKQAVQYFSSAEAEWEQNI